MGNLFIFIDETGTMPLDKEKDIFLAAGLGVFKNLPIFIEKKGYIAWLISELVKHSAIPFVAYINPTEEFKKKMQLKFDKVERMAKSTFDKTKKNIKYFSPNGLDRRNSLWITTINQCISQIIINAIEYHPIEELTIYLDQKSLKSTSLNLFENQIRKKLNLMHDTLDKINHKNQADIIIHKSRLNWNNKLRIIWSNEHEAYPACCGLDLAHYLGHHFYKDFNKRELDDSFQKCLIKAGYKNHSAEINDILLKELSEKTIKDWENNTGLKYND